MVNLCIHPSLNNLLAKGPKILNRALRSSDEDTAGSNVWLPNLNSRILLI